MTRHEYEGRPWQQRGRCLECGQRMASYRRVRACACGGRVVYR